MARKRKISSKKLIYLLIALAISVFVGIVSGEALRLSEKPSEYIGLTFSVLAASVFAVVSIVGDPSMLLPGARRVAWESAEAIQVQIQRLSVVFTIHLLVLFLLVISEIIESLHLVSYYWVFNILAGFSMLGFLMSIGLPFELGAIQRERLRQEIAKRSKD